MLKQSLLNKYRKAHRQKPSIITSIQAELHSINYNLSDNQCYFYINDSTTRTYGHYYILQLYLLPLIGEFKGIEFRPKAFFCVNNIIARPVFYNDFRIFHPNIDVYTCEIIFQEIVNLWNPAFGVIHLLNSMKKVILRPNVCLVQNNEFNRRAAWNYHYNKAQFRNLLINHHPNDLEIQVNQQFVQFNHRMMMIGNNNMADKNSGCDTEVMGGSQSQLQQKQQLFWCLPGINGQRCSNANNVTIDYQSFNKFINEAVFELIEIPLIQDYLNGIHIEYPSILQFNQ